ncbi:hypothetical protein LOK74_04855 [Brevibacillus humidisoli]|uniref:hypothetical protein n=1 Tax=Brevibacillus humidisoli TaxID=2895522 RepID=UPI001E60B641|nr:hypothetical protein [Brevibacillus humidisoli]UFJ41836.1 hypothetical protein LOK74_04855 [Brevibacillus humidisoli]
MIPADVKQLLHDIRLIGGGEDRYDSPDDWDVIYNILDRQNAAVDPDSPDWQIIREALAREKDEIQQEMDRFYWDGFW